MGSESLAVTAPARPRQQYVQGGLEDLLPRREEFDKDQRLGVDDRVEVSVGEVNDVRGEDGLDEGQRSGRREQTRKPHRERRRGGEEKERAWGWAAARPRGL